MPLKGHNLSTGLLLLPPIGHPTGDGDQGHQAREHHPPVQNLKLLLLYLNIIIIIIMIITVVLWFVK